MELKDMILSTLAELDKKEPFEKQEVEEKPKEQPKEQQKEQPKEKIIAKIEVSEDEPLSEEKMFLNSVKERVLVLFEGLQSPKNDNMETKLDITLNFLEFLLASIEKRLDKVK